MDPRAVSQLDEASWWQRVYRAGQRQLTVRAVVTGLALGFVLSFSNVYSGLKTGLFFTMGLPACLASFAIWRLLAAVRLARTPLSLLEANCMQSTASSAAYATGNMVVGAFPAMLLLSVTPANPAGVQLHWYTLAAWIAVVAALGVTLAIPLKRQLINRERLAFPSGSAAAIMLDGLHRASQTMRSQARSLLSATIVGAVLPLVRDLHSLRNVPLLRNIRVLRELPLIPDSSKIFDWLPQISAAGAAFPVSSAGLVLDHSLLLVAAGAFIGVRATAWMLIGGVITAFGLAPMALSSLWVDGSGHQIAAATSLGSAPGEVGLWLAAPLLVSYALVALISNWRAFVRTFAGARGARVPSDALSARIEIPLSWFWYGFALCGGVAVVLGQVLFDIPIALGCVAVAASLVFSMVAARVTGETDINPGGPTGKLTQLGFGVLRPQHPSTNLMTAAMTHASSVACADLLSDLKSGYLLGADPRRQFVAQAIGIAAGTCASVLAYFILIPDASALTSSAGHPAQFAAPGAHQFRAIAELLQFGLDKLHPLNRVLVVIGAISGAVLGAVERLAPRRIARWLPSTAGLGLGLFLPLSLSLAMLLGAAIAAIAMRRATSAVRYVWPVSAGLLAGESLAGVVVTLLNNFIL